MKTLCFIAHLDILGYFCLDGFISDTDIVDYSLGIFGRRDQDRRFFDQPGHAGILQDRDRRGGDGRDPAVFK